MPASHSMMAATMGLLVAGLLLARRDSLQLRQWQPVTARLKLLAAVPLLLVSLVALCIPSARHVGRHAIVPYHAQDRVVTAGIWTVHFSLDQGMWDSTRRMSDLIKDMQLDIVGLLETDLHRTVFGNRDLTQYLGESLGMYADIGPGPDKHTWGAVLLSKVSDCRTSRAGSALTCYLYSSPSSTRPIIYSPPHTASSPLQFTLSWTSTASTHTSL